jgi:galactan endo-beta-1,3-galactanase
MKGKVMYCWRLAGLAFGIGLGAASIMHAQTTETILDGTSFNSITALEAEWNYNYPWGDTHNGSAKMYPSQVSLSGGVLTISAVTPDPNGSTYKYAAGTIHMKDSICITEQYPEWTFSGEFQAPNTRGTWPAFWITHAGNWTHEVDILEYKGTTENWFNTYDGGWETTRVTVPDSLTAWHSYKLVASKVNAADVRTQFYLDGVLKGTHTLSGGMGKCFWLIINLQMEGSSGTPGPTSPTAYRARNVVVTRTVLPPPPPLASGTYKITAKHSGKALKPIATTAGSLVQQFRYRKADQAMRWTVTDIGGGQYMILNVQSGRRMSIVGDSTANGANIDIDNASASNAQKWTITPLGGGYYNVINVNSGKLLDISGASTADGGQAIQWDPNGGDNQQYSFTAP